MSKKIIELPDACLEYFPGFFSQEESDRYLGYFLKSIEWQQDKIKMFGKEFLQPRLTALFGEKEKSYTYSGITMLPEPFPSPILNIKSKCEEILGEKFNICLLNLYRNGSDSMGWHADDERELGKNPVIASVSFGAERIFHLKHQKDPSLREKLVLENGSLLLMAGTTQHFWKHQLPKTKKKVGPRVNLTFRKVY
ncbi:alpha-ketoglutarate-dependent dioxygenase AlkB [Christiangramia fulva]|uniref:Alpha-ketoglutarate-dependent dioxygenase AlkB n=1 Tax=Christiangramia fulva TaxID=2126553 RepID=A0A2R3Z687_9FLAO|nr:alpha-ketoglutarate-dependent dioxygenase AlkB [Christiangramia fulva]AVR45770.1 alpha-ketoglutarate-dependent dioxygenase AlkB [Christiangramia fulva]